MLTKQSEQFLTELRMYLISKGKNDTDINEIVEELEVHLTEAEAAGKDVTHIIGESPKQYVKSISQSMKTDFRQLAGLLPRMVLLVAAYFSFGPAIEGEFVLSENILTITLIGAAIGIAAYGFSFFKVLPRFFHSKWGYIIISVANVLITGLGVVFLLVFKERGATASFIATPMQNNLIIAGCIIIFVAAALYTKTWYFIVIPAFTAIGSLAKRFIPEDINHNPTYISYTIIGICCITIVVLFVLIKKKGLFQKSH